MPPHPVRRFLAAAGVLAASLAVMAQAPSRVPAVGVLVPGPSPRAAPDPSAVVFEQGLRELGWSPGRTVKIAVRYADGQAGRLQDLAHDLVRQKVDVIVARALPSIRAAQAIGVTVPPAILAQASEVIQ